MNTRQIMILVHFHDASIEGKIKADDRLQILNKSGNAFDRNQNKTQMLFFFLSHAFLFAGNRGHFLTFDNFGNKIKRK